MTLARKLIAAITALVLPAAVQAEGPCPSFEVIGTGPDLVLVPGLGSSPDVWDGVRDSLSKDYRLHLVHVAGFAGRAPEGDPSALLDHAQAEVIRHLDCQKVERAIYAGHSMGGFLGLILAADHSDRISKVVVVDSLPFFPLVFDPAATPESIAPRADAMRSALLSQDNAAFAAGQRMGVRTLVRNQAYHERVAEWSITSDRASFAGAMHALMTTDLRPRLQSITSPVTVIFASNSFAPRTLVEPIYRKAYHGLDRAEFVVIEDSYHFIMFDQPEAFHQALASAIRRE